MTKIALIANTCKSRSDYLETCPLPTFYMEDFSILGIIVENYDSARAVLKKYGYHTVDRESGSDILVEHVKQIGTVMNTLRHHGIAAEFSDIADTMYQA